MVWTIWISDIENVRFSNESGFWMSGIRILNVLNSDLYCMLNNLNNGHGKLSVIWILPVTLVVHADQVVVSQPVWENRQRRRWLCLSWYDYTPVLCHSGCLLKALKKKHLMKCRTVITYRQSPIFLLITKDFL